MRKVVFNKFIPMKREKLEGSNYETKVPGTGCMQTDYPNEGLFITWGLDSEEYETGGASYTVAIIEKPNGEVENVHPNNLKFINE